MELESQKVRKSETGCLELEDLQRTADFINDVNMPLLAIDKQQEESPLYCCLVVGVWHPDHNKDRYPNVCVVT